MDGLTTLLAMCGLEVNSVMQSFLKRHRTVLLYSGLGLLIVLLSVLFRADVIINNLIAPPTPIPSRMVFNALQSEMTLVTLRQPFANPSVQVNASQGMVCRWYATHAIEGEITTGVDLSGLTEADVFYDPIQDRYYITLPSPQITSCSIDPTNFSQYNQRGEVPITCPIDWNAIRNLANYAVLTEFRDEALAAGALSQSERSIMVEVNRIVKSLTGKEAVITFDPNRRTQLYDRTCAPDTGGWSYDPNTDLWTMP